MSGPISSGDDAAIVITRAGTITDEHASGRDISGRTLVFASGAGDAGSPTNPLETSISSIEASSTGGIFLDNDQALTIGGVGAAVGLNVGGGIGIITDTRLDVTEHVHAVGDIRLTARDEADPTANQVALASDVHITSTGGDIALLGGDVFQLQSGHQLSADGGSGEIVIAFDWGNADPGQGNSFTLPRKVDGVFAASTLRFVGDSDSETLIIPELFLPKGSSTESLIVFEGGSGNDSVTATLIDAPSVETRLMNVNVEAVHFQSVNALDASWLLDTDPTTQQIPLFDQPDLVTDVAYLASPATGGTRIVQSAHSIISRFETLDVDYTFGSGVDSLTVLALKHPVDVKLGNGNDVATVGGNRGTTPVHPGNV
ncbi:MAG: hypothetical protein R3C05_19150, partial [Pirellulaceae bacterium]